MLDLRQRHAVCHINFQDNVSKPLGSDMPGLLVDVRRKHKAVANMAANQAGNYQI
jgi:hypothetical protein